MTNNQIFVALTRIVRLQEKILETTEKAVIEISAVRSSALDALNETQVELAILKEEMGLKKDSMPIIDDGGPWEAA